LNGSSTVVFCSAAARAITAAANPIAGRWTGSSRWRAGQDARASLATQTTIRAAAAAAVNQRSQIATVCASGGSERTRKTLTVQFARQPGSK
jgi:Tfp pilus assembly major pilin PilA